MEENKQYLEENKENDIPVVTELEADPIDQDFLVSDSLVQDFAKALQKIEAYVPTTYVDFSEPDIDAAHLNKSELALKRVTDAMNSALDVINAQVTQISNLEKQVTQLNSDYIRIHVAEESTSGSVLSFLSGLYYCTPNVQDLPETGHYYLVEVLCYYSNHAESERILTAIEATNGSMYFRIYVNRKWSDWKPRN